MADRTPLMAGNWKMNLDHHEATHLVQKLAWELKDKDHDYGDVEVVGEPQQGMAGADFQTPSGPPASDQARLAPALQPR